MSKIAKKRVNAKGGDMTMAEQEEFNQMHQDAQAAQDEANRIEQDRQNELAAQIRRAQDRENELAEQIRRAQDRENELARQSKLERERLEQQLRTREAELSVQSSRVRRADELYDRLAYDRINNYVLASVPLTYRLQLADRVSALARERLLAGRSEPVIINEITELVKQLTDVKKKKPVSRKKKTSVKKKTSTKKSAKKKR